MFTNKILFSVFQSKKMSNVVAEFISEHSGSFGISGNNCDWQQLMPPCQSHSRASAEMK